MALYVTEGILLFYMCKLWALRFYKTTYLITTSCPETKQINFRYISPICTYAARERICTKFGADVGVVDIICDKFLSIG